MDEVLEDLRDRWQAIEDDYAQLFEGLGRMVWHHRDLSVPPIKEQIRLLEDARARQRTISESIDAIKNAAASVKVKPA